MKTKILITAILVSIFFASCKKDDKAVIEAPIPQYSILKTWKQQKWYLDSINGEMLNTVQTWKFVNDSIIKRTVSFPNTTEYETYTITDKWSYSTYDKNSIQVEFDSLFYVMNSGTANSNGTKTYKIKSLTNSELILEESYLPYIYEKYIFVAEN